MVDEGLECQAVIDQRPLSLLGQVCQGQCLRRFVWDQPEQETLTRQGSKDGNIADGSFLLGFIINEELRIINCFTERAMVMPKLRKVQTPSGEDKLGAPNDLIIIRVTCVNARSLLTLRLAARA